MSLLPCFIPKPLPSRRRWWIAHKGPIPEGLWVLHHCDNGDCREETHLYLGTPSQNTRDSVERGRHFTPFRGTTLAEKRSDPQWRSRISAARMGHETTVETQEKIRQTLTGSTLPLEVRQKISAANKGKPKPPRSEEHKRKLSESLTGKTYPNRKSPRRRDVRD
jgi:hypothetical protein